MGTKKKRKEPSVLEALAWHAKQLGISYGKLVLTMRQEEIDHVYQEYLAMQNQRYTRDHRPEELQHGGKDRQEETE